MARLTEKEWQQVLPFIARLKTQRRDAAYKHLVKGMSLARAGEAYGMNRQNVFSAVQVILRHQARLLASGMSTNRPVPKGWVRMEVAVPRSQVSTLRKLIDALCGGQTPKKSK